MTQPPVTLFVEDLAALAAALPPERRFPVLERVLSRGRPARLAADAPNQARYELLGANPAEPPAVAALCRVSEQGAAGDRGVYWLRADPVTLRADMSRVFMLSCGTADYGPQEREELGRLVGETLSREGIELVQTRQGYWLMALSEPPGFEFPPLHEALGRDLADVLPDHPGATAWKRRMTDIQVELHQAGFNRRRRASGLQEINSVWFWGGGVAPPVEPAAFSSVVSHDPVSRGLALLAGVPVAGDADLSAVDAPALVDWLIKTADAPREGEALERAAEQLLLSPAARQYGLRLVAGNGQSWEFRPFDAYRVWRRAAPLSGHFSSNPGRG